MAVSAPSAVGAAYRRRSSTSAPTMRPAATSSPAFATASRSRARNGASACSRSRGRECCRLREFVEGTQAVVRVGSGDHAPPDAPLAHAADRRVRVCGGEPAERGGVLRARGRAARGRRRAPRVTSGAPRPARCTRSRRAPAAPRVARGSARLSGGCPAGLADLKVGAWSGDQGSGRPCDAPWPSSSCSSWRSPPRPSRRSAGGATAVRRRVRCTGRRSGSAAIRPPGRPPGRERRMAARSGPA